MPPAQNLGAALAATWPLLLGFAVIMLGGGLQGTLLGLRAAMEAFPAATTGLIMSAYYVGYLLGSRLTIHLVSRVGHVRVFAAMTALASIMILVHALAVTALIWGTLRFLSGICFAGIYIVAESWLNDRASNQNRGQIFSIYMMINFAGLGGGQFLLNLADPLDPTLFMVVSLLVSLAAVPLVLSSRPSPAFDQPSKLTFAFVYSHSPMAVFGALSSGLASGAVFGMGAVFATISGLTVAQTAVFVAMPIFGAMLLQWPLGWLSDRVDRRQVIKLAALLALLAALGALATTVGSAAFFAVMALLGGVTLPVYGIAASHLNDHLDPVDMVAASATLIVLSGVGAAFGPLLSGLFMGQWGAPGFLWFFAAVNMALLGATVWRIRRVDLPEDLSKGRWQVLRPVASPVAATVVAESQAESVLEEASEAQEPGNGTSE